MNKAGLRFITVVLILTLFAGCSGLDGSDLPEGSGQAPLQEPVVLNLMLNSPELTEQYHEMKNVYEAYRPNVTLKMDIRQNDYITVLNTKLNSGDVPDVFVSSAYNDNHVYQNYLYALNGQPFIQNIEPFLLSGVTVNGSVTGCPFLVQSHSFIYNQALFTFAGITALPQTLDEYRTACEQLSAKGVQPFATGFADWWVLPQTFYPSMSDVYTGNYQGLFKGMESGAAKVGELPETAFALDVLDLIKQYGGSAPMESTFENQCADFATGKAAMIHQGSWAEQTILGINPDVQLGYLKAPRKDGKGVLAVDSNLTLRVYKDSSALDETLSFLNWLYTSEYGKRWIPERVKQLSPQMNAPVPDTPLSVQTAEAIKSSQTCVWWIFAGPKGIEQPLGLALQEYVSGNRSREQTKAAITELFIVEKS